MATITHATSPSGSDEPAYGVSKSEWDEAHTVSDIAEADLAVRTKADACLTP